MKLRKAIKKIVAIGATTLLGATMIASAVDLSEYPSPFIQDGVFTGMLVVGDKAAAEDVIGVSDVAMSLQYAAIGGGEGGGTVVSGDAWRVGTSSKKLEMQNNYGNVGNETIRDIMNSIDEDELAPLADGSITTEKGTAGYNQYINFDDRARQGGYVKFLENDDDVAGDYLYFKSGAEISRYSMEFKTSLQSDVEDSSGSKDTTGTYLGDYEDETLTIMGKDFNVVKARRVTSVGSNVELTLMGGAVKDTLNEGETKTYTIQGKDYEVTVTAITDSAPIIAKFNINGESTRSLKDGDSATLSDGTEIGISDIIPNEAGDVTQDLVEFYLGASKVYLKDTNINDTSSSNDLEFGSERIDDAHVVISGSDDGTTFSIDTIQINVSADDDFYVAPGHSLTEYMEEPQAFLGLLDFKYEGLESVDTEEIRVKTAGDDQYELVFTDGDGNSATIPIAYTKSSSSLKFGDDDNSLINNEAQEIVKNDYLIVSDNSQDRGNRNTYALRYKGADKVASGETALVKFDNLGDGSRIEQTFSETQGLVADATLKLGGATFGVLNNSLATADDFDILVDLDGDGTFNLTNEINITTDGGLEIDLDNATYGATNHIILTFTTPNSNDYDNIKPLDLNLNISAASSEVTFAQLAGDPLTFVSPSDEENVKYAYTSMGAKYTWTSPTNDPQQLTIEYPKQQRLPMVYVTIGSTEIIPGSAESTEAVTANKIEVGATKLASEVADVAAQNLILVGGPCANAAAAEVQGNPANCAAGYTAGKGLLELVDTGEGNVALIVAGYSAADTRATTTVLANYGDYELMGTKMEVVTATSTVREVTESELAEETMEETPPADETAEQTV
jgi:hypothetical protein